MNFQHTIPCCAIVVAGGSGLRMGSGIPKQFIELSGKPVLMHSIKAFSRYCNGMDIVAVIPARQVDYWKELCIEYRFTVKHQIVEGGHTRFHSVKNGLAYLPDSGLVAVHDGVRPLIDHATIDRCMREAAVCGSAVPVMEVIDSVREISDNGSRVIDRSKLRLVQTPQVFDLAKLKAAYNREYQPEFTDDASVFECSGHSIRLVAGSSRNIKITTPGDLTVAQWLINNSD